MTSLKRSTRIVAAAMLLVVAGCTSGSSEPDAGGGRTSIVPVKLVDVPDRVGSYSEEFTLPSGAKRLTISTTCASSAATGSTPGAVFAIKQASSGKSVLTLKSECPSLDDPFGSETDLPKDAASDLVVRVTPDDPDQLTWSLTVTAS